ncbi:MAG: phytanoyl-CoA dioxygenase family protein [Pseudomonadota bacterium]
MAAFTDAQRSQFWQDGFITVEGAVSGTLLAKLRADMDAWIVESQGHTEPFGEMKDGRPRFDMQPGHSAEAPALRRVSAPTEISGAYFEAMANSAMTDMVAELIGPNVKLHHTKINAKQPGSATEVKWHQDFAFTPHSNSDLITALLMVDDVTPENGPLEVRPGSHKGPLHSLWHDGAFTGAVAPEIEAEMKAAAVSCYGPAGSVCLMHTKVMHGSAPNRSSSPRTLFISVYSAGDAAACCPNPVPNIHEGLFVRGVNPNSVRAEAFSVETPAYPDGASFFTQQEAAARSYALVATL